MNEKVKAGLSGLPISDFILKVRYIISVIVSSGNFPNLPHPAAEILADVDMLSELQGEVVAGNRIHVGSRNALLASIRRKMTANAAHVNGVAIGQPSLLESSGFEIAKDRTPRGVPSVVTKISCKSVQPSGRVKVFWSASKERDYYILEKRVGEQGTWETVNISTKVNHILSGFPIRQDVSFRVAAVNGAGMSPWSKVATVTVL